MKNHHFCTVIVSDLRFLIFFYLFSSLPLTPERKLFFTNTVQPDVLARAWSNMIRRRYRRVSNNVFAHNNDNNITTIMMCTRVIFSLPCVQQYYVLGIYVCVPDVKVGYTVHTSLLRFTYTAMSIPNAYENGSFFF